MIRALLFFLLLTGAAAAQPACNPAQPTSLPCQSQSTNLQQTDILYGTQAQGPQRANQTVKVPISQLLNSGFPATLGPLSVPSNIAVVGKGTFGSLAYGTEFDLKASCGATGNGSADDSGPLALCINKVNSSYAAHVPAYIHVPAGIFLIKNGTTIPAFSPTVPGAVIGDGNHKAYFELDTSFTGDLFSWSEAWGGTAYIGPAFNPTGDNAGPTVIGLTVAGSTAASTQQNAFRFYDRNDLILMRDIDVFFLNGQCMSIGRTLNQTQAWARESSF